MSLTSTRSQLERLGRAEPSLEGLKPRVYAGIAAGAVVDVGGVQGEIAKHDPILTRRWQVASKLGGPVATETPLLVREPPDEQGVPSTKYRVQPVVVVYPSTVPVVLGTSLLAEPLVEVMPMTHVYLTVTWQFGPARLGCTAAEIVLSARDDLEASNDLSPFDAQTNTRTWTQSLGLVNAEGEYVAAGGLGTNPFIPPQLNL